MLIITTTKKIDQEIARIKREVSNELITRFVRQGVIDPAAFRSCESIAPDLTNFDTSSIPAGKIFEEIMSEEIKKTWT